MNQEITENKIIEYLKKGHKINWFCIKGNLIYMINKKRIDTMTIIRLKKQGIIEIQHKENKYYGMNIWEGKMIYANKEKEVV